MSILGNRVLRTEDPKFLTAGGSYLDDLVIEGAAYVTYVRSTVAHARLTGVDTSEAAGAPGVIGVFTSADVDLEPLAPGIIMLNQAVRTPFLARDVVRYVGEPVVALVTGIRDIAAAENLALAGGPGKLQRTVSGQSLFQIDTAKKEIRTICIAL